MQILMKHIRYQAIGNTVGIESAVDDFWEIADDGFVVRSVQILSDGTVLKYDQVHAADSFGILPEGVITEQMLADHSVGKVSRISLSGFESCGRQRRKTKQKDEYPCAAYSISGGA